MPQNAAAVQWRNGIRLKTNSRRLIRMMVAEQQSNRKQRRKVLRRDARIVNRQRHRVKTAIAPPAPHA